MQNKAVAEQGLEEGEEEEQRGVEQVEDVGLGWMEACCTALDLHAAEPAVQVSRTSSEPRLGSSRTLVNGLVLLQEAASWAVHSLLLHGAGLKPSEEEQDQRYTCGTATVTCRKSSSRGTIPCQAYFMETCGCFQDSCSQAADGGHVAPLLVSLCV